MAHKLKCWAKEGKDSWKHINSNHSVDVRSDRPFGYVIHGAEQSTNRYRSKKSALLEAKSYMEKHDRC